jgi:redox-sensitive bicupin YhaK (pirin superfamily)
MTAGSGVEHGEFNASKTEPVHFIQIWIKPGQRGITPTYDQKRFPEEDRRGKLRLVASPDGADGSIKINQDARLYATLLDEGQRVELPLSAGRHAWIQVVRGSLSANGQRLEQGDGAAISDEQQIALQGADPSEVLVFDLA